MTIIETTTTTKSLFFSTLLLLLAATLRTTSGAFVELTDVSQSVTAIKISPACDDSNLGVPNTMFTIEPASSVTVASDPPNLVTVSGGTTMTFTWNPDVSATADSGGVKIGIPADQLTSVTVERAKTAQLLDGFTSVTNLEVSGASTLFATISSSSSTASSALSLTVSGASTANVKSNVNVNGGSISGASKATVETPTYDALDVSGASTLKVNGAVGGGSVSGASTVTATGDVTGSINISGASTLNAISCDSVSTSGASSCNSSGSGSGSQSVTVDVSQQATTMDGQSKCWGGSLGLGQVFGGLFSGSESSTSLSFNTAIIGVAAATAAAVVAM